MDKKTLDYFNDGTIRFNSRQKLNYGEWLIGEFAQLGYKGYTDVNRRFLSKSTNVYIGDFATANTVFIVPYESPKKVFWPHYKLYAQDGNLYGKKMFLPVYGPLIIGYVILLLAVYGLPYLFSGNVYFVLLLLSIVYFFFLMAMVFRGMANKWNATGRDAAIALAYDIAKQTMDRKRREIAFIFTDRNDSSTSGSKWAGEFLDTLKRKPKIIALAYIGSGNTISLAYVKGYKKQAQALSKKDIKRVKMTSIEGEGLFQTPLQYINRGVMISTGKMNGDQFYVENVCCSKDKVIDEDLVENVERMILESLKPKEK